MQHYFSKPGGAEAAKWHPSCHAAAPDTASRSIAFPPTSGDTLTLLAASLDTLFLQPVEDQKRR
jgi:hypothetical protein